MKYLALYGDTQGTINADINASSNTLALRDSVGNISFAQVAATELKTSGILTLAPPVTKTSAFTADTSATHFICDATSAAFTATLPAAAGVPGRVYVFHKKDNVHNVTVQGAGSENIDGANTAVISTQYGTLRVISDGTQWWTY